MYWTEGDPFSTFSVISVLEDDIDEILSGIIEDFYEPMNDFHKMTSIHVQWYGFQNEHKEKAQALIRDHVKDLAEAIGKIHL